MAQPLAEPFLTYADIKPSQRATEIARKWQDRNELAPCIPKEQCINPRLDSHGKVKLPPLLERKPDFKVSFLQYATSNSNDLSAELLLAYLHKTELPALLEEFREELDFPEYTMFELLQEHRLTKLSVPTIHRWMGLLGFKYETRQKCYYVNGHEKPDTKAYRKKFERHYFEYEKLMHRWIQI